MNAVIELIQHLWQSPTNGVMTSTFADAVYWRLIGQSIEVRRMGLFSMLKSMNIGAGAEVGCADGRVLMSNIRNRGITARLGCPFKGIGWHRMGT